MAHPPWVIGDLIQPRYLDTLQELLSDWSDNVLLVASGPTIIVPGSASAPAELVIDGQMRVAATQHAANISGASGIYGVWATTTSGATSFGIAVGTSPPVAAHLRNLGSVGFNGSQIVEVAPAVREVNVSNIFGHAPSEAATADAVPAARLDGTLDPAWLTNLEEGRVPVGGVREVWVPSGVAFSAPTGWHVLDGSVLPAASHAFSGVSSVTLPDMRNKHSLGANTSNVYATAGNDAGTAPGLSGQGGDQTTKAPSHGHAAGGHTHTLTSHTHAADHYHSFDAHAHYISDYHTVHRGVTPHLASSALIFQHSTDAEQVDTNQNSFSTGGAAPGTGPDSGIPITNNANAAVDIRPWSCGLAYIMRVM